LAGGVYTKRNYTGVLTPVVATVTASGDTIIHTPASGSLIINLGGSGSVAVTAHLQEIN